MTTRGEIAPDFTLTGTQGDTIREFTLSEIADGRPVVLAFYVYDFSPVCTTQMCEIDDMEFLTFNEEIAVLGISTDGPYSHRQFIETNGISYPLLTDVDKHVYEQYGLLDASDGRRQPTRGIVVIDADRTVQYRWAAEDNWDDWNTAPMKEAYDVIQSLPAATGE